MTETADSVTLKIWNRSTMDRMLEAAVQDLATRAKASKRGIVVTRSGPNTFTASLSHDVPYGTTREVVAW